MKTYEAAQHKVGDKILVTYSDDEVLEIIGYQIHGIGHDGYLLASYVCRQQDGREVFVHPGRIVGVLLPAQGANWASAHRQAGVFDTQTEVA